MKPIFFSFLIVLLASCSKIATEVGEEESEKITTLEIIQKANVDTCCYKYVEINDVTYILRDNKVVHKVTNNTDTVKFLSFIILIFFPLLLILKLIFTELI